MQFSEHLWQITTPIYQQIVQHPFNTELAEGVLDEKCFIFYMAQDSYFLINFSRALALVAGRSITSKTINQFLNFSLGALCSERELHVSFLPSNINTDKIEPSPSCFAYSQYLIATAATATVEEAIAALLPCFWIYREVGLGIARNCQRNNPYIRWIETYTSETYSNVVNQAICLTDELADCCSSEVLDRMKEAFEFSAIFEWHFWDDAYKMRVFRNHQEILPLLNNTY